MCKRVVKLKDGLIIDSILNKIVILCFQETLGLEFFKLFQKIN